MTLGYNDKLADIRTHIWKNLAILRKNEEYRNAINSILSEVNYNRLNEEDILYIMGDVLRMKTWKEVKVTES